MLKQKINFAGDVLLVDDDPDDLRLMGYAMDKVCDGCTLHAVDNGFDAIAFLKGVLGDDCPPLPDLVILDINMPGMSGFDVLDEVRTLPNLSAVPFVVFSTACVPAVKLRALELGASDFFSNPLSFADLQGVLRCIIQRWCMVSGGSGPNA